MADASAEEGEAGHMYVAVVVATKSAERVGWSFIVWLRCKKPEKRCCVDDWNR